MKIHIRFVESGDEYFIQRRYFGFIWSYIVYYVTSDDTTWDEKYKNKSKKELLIDVIDNELLFAKRFYDVIEHSTIKIGY